MGNSTNTSILIVLGVWRFGASCLGAWCLTACASAPGRDAAGEAELLQAPLCGAPIDGGAPADAELMPPVPPPVFDCAVTLTKLSYDSPGADTAEVVELSVSGQFVRDGVRATFKDCGVDAVELINGAGANTCSIYRTIPIGAVAVPADGILVLCASDSTFAGSKICDITGADGVQLRNGWLQNGPNDALVLRGRAPAGFSYEGESSACNEPSWTALPADKGEARGEPDEIIVNCGGHFEISSSAVLRQLPSCARLSEPRDAATGARPAAPSGTSHRAARQDAGAALEEGSVVAPAGTAEVLNQDAMPAPAVAQFGDAHSPPNWHDYTAKDGGAGELSPPQLEAGCQLTPRKSSSRLPFDLGLVAVLALSSFRRANRWRPQAPR